MNFVIKCKAKYLNRMVRIAWRKAQEKESKENL